MRRENKILTFHTTLNMRLGRKLPPLLESVAAVIKLEKFLIEIFYDFIYFPEKLF